MRPAPELLLPRPRRASWAVWGGSIALHALLLALLMFRARVPTMVPLPGEVRLAELPQVELPRISGRAPVSHAVRSRAATAGSPAVTTIPEDRVDSGSTVAASGAAGNGVEMGSERYRRIGPARATGRVWVRPLPLPPRELAARLTRSHSELADSAVTAIIQAFLDSIATDPATRAVRPPDWTTTLAGAKFGLDAKWIYVAGLKIPTALLALLPIPAGGNDQQAFDRSEALYRDLRQAAQRAANVAEFKQAIKDIRERTEAERQFKKNQRTPPPPDLTPEDAPK